MDDPQPPNDSQSPNLGEPADADEGLTVEKLGAVILVLADRIQKLETSVQWLNRFLDHLKVGGLYSNAHRDLFVELFERAGLATVEGKPIRQWFYEESKKHTQNLLIQMEDNDPEAAANFQALFDRIVPEKDRES